MAIAIETVTPTPISPEVHVLTPRGEAALAVIRLRRQLEALDTFDRAYVLDLVQEMTEDLTDVR